MYALHWNCPLYLILPGMPGLKLGDNIIIAFLVHLYTEKMGIF